MAKWRAQGGGINLGLSKRWREFRARSYVHTFIHGSEGRKLLFVLIHRVLKTIYVVFGMNKEWVY